MWGFLPQVVMGIETWLLHFNPNPSRSFWNGTIQHSQGEGIQENDGSRNEKSVTV
jgi:hypothetical protein